MPWVRIGTLVAAACEVRELTVIKPCCITSCWVEEEEEEEEAGEDGGSEVTNCRTWLELVEGTITDLLTTAEILLVATVVDVFECFCIMALKAISLTVSCHGSCAALDSTSVSAI